MNITEFLPQGLFDFQPLKVATGSEVLMFSGLVKKSLGTKLAQFFTFSVFQTPSICRMGQNWCYSRCFIVWRLLVEKEQQLSKWKQLDCLWKKKCNPNLVPRAIPSQLSSTKAPGTKLTVSHVDRAKKWLCKSQARAEQTGNDGIDT